MHGGREYHSCSIRDIFQAIKTVSSKKLDGASLLPCFLPRVATTRHVCRFYVPTLQLKIEREQEALRLKALDEEESNGIAPSTAAVDVKGSRVQLDLHSGKKVTEVDWVALLDGSRVLELLYRLEVLLYLVELG